MRNKSIKLFKLLIKKFFYNVKKKNSIPIIIVFPQKKDIEIFRKGKNNYCKFFKSIKNIKVIDLTEFLLNKNIQKIYFDDEYGGHLTIYGNKIVAKEIQKELNYV